MDARLLADAGFPCPEDGYFYVRPWKYSSTVRLLQQRAMREVERRAFEP
jgi:hypothetical protein